MRREDGMRIHHGDERVTIWHGDALEVLRGLPDASVDSVVTDPPYGLEFMGKDWDRFATGRGAKYAKGGDLDPENIAERSGKGGAGPSYVNRPAKRCALCGKQSWSGSPCVCPEPQWIMDNSPLHSFQAWCTLWATECLRVLKPGGHLLAFGGTRTWHRLACAVEDVGFEVRDSIAWLYGSGFPKSLDVSKAIDKMDATHERRARALRFTAWMRSTGITSRQIDEATGTTMGGHYLTAESQPAVATMAHLDTLRPLLPPVPEWVEEMARQRTVESQAFASREVVGKSAHKSGIGNASAGHYTVGGTIAEHVDITAPATPAAERWQGWGTALKPAFEPVVVARKPLAGTVAANVLQHGTGALNIDGCRVESGEKWAGNNEPGNGKNGYGPDDEDGWTGAWTKRSQSHPSGRWPTNVVLDDSQATELDEQSGERKAGGNITNAAPSNPAKDVYGEYGRVEWAGHGDTGGASRFFPTFRYEAKAPATERPFYYRPTCECEDAWPTHTPSAARATDGTTAPASLSTSKSGSATTGDLSPTATRSTTSTATSSTTTPTTSSPSPRPTTSASTPAANSETATGGSRAAFAASSSPLAPVTGTSAVRGGRSTDDAGRATSQGWSATSVCGECGAPTRREAHATVKPLSLMSWLVRLVTPPGGIVLDPFAGSGTTVEACIVEGFHCIAIEREADYLPLIMQRVNRRRDPVAYMRSAGDDLGLFELDDAGQVVDEPVEKPQGRWPTNVILGRSQVEELDRQSGPLHTQDPETRYRASDPSWSPSGTERGTHGTSTQRTGGRAEAGTGASRFFPIVDEETGA